MDGQKRVDHVVGSKFFVVYNDFCTEHCTGGLAMHRRLQRVDMLMTTPLDRISFMNGLRVHSLRINKCQNLSISFLNIDK